MDPALTPPSITVPALLRKYGLSPRKGLGQNFLLDAGVLRKLVEAAEVDASSTVLEIGPGAGSLTLALAQVARRVVAVEIDAHLIPLLNEVLAGSPNVTLIQGDILEIDPAALGTPDGYLVVANIPYYITSAIIRRLLEAPVKPARMVLTMQREVAARICAEPGDMSLLALSVQVYGRPQPVLRIPAGAFYPPPNVDSVSLRVDLYPEPLVPMQNLPAFFTLIKAGFAQKRKTLRNTLTAGIGWPAQRVTALLTEAEIDPQRRAETLSLPEWERLTRLYQAHTGPEGAKGP